MKIIKKLVPVNKRKQNRGTNGKRFITIHQTGNTNKGADADAHARLQLNNSRAASWHYTVDDKEAIQSYPHSSRCWHAGDGSGNGNNNSIAIEICVNKDGNYQQALKNAAMLTKKLLKDLGLNINDVKQHNHWSGKNCPSQLRGKKSGIDWNKFLKMIDDSAKPIDNKPVKPTVPSSKLYVDGIGGVLTISKAQKIAGTPIDGVISGQSSRRKVHYRGLTKVRYTNPAIGSQFVGKLQQELNKKGHQLHVDRVLGPVTIRAWQTELKVEADSYFGKISCTAWQRKLNTGKLF